jgi:hypothetical protein
MTPAENPLPRAPRTRSLQDDLMQDLRRTTPLPPRTTAPARTRAEHPGTDPVPSRSDAAAVEVRVTRSRWTSLRVRSNPGRSGFEVSAGPLRLSLAVVDR